MGALLARVPKILVRPVTGRWAIVLVALGFLLSVGTIVIDRYVADMLRDFDSLFDARQRYEDSEIVCEGKMSAACARDASDRTRLPVASIEDPDEFGLRLDAMVAAEIRGRYFTHQELRAESLIVSISTNSRGSKSGKHVGTTTAGERRAEVWEDEGSYEIRWTSDGVPYVIGVVSMSLSPQPEFLRSERQLAGDLFKGLVVTSPTSNK